MRILYVYNTRTRFVMDDLDLLRSNHQVTEWYQAGRWYNPFRLQSEVRRHDLVFCWFASWHSFGPVLLSRLLNKPSIVVIGGYDTANLPEAGYGSQRGGLRRVISRSVIRNATHLVVNSHFSRQEAVEGAGADPAKISVIHHGVRTHDFGVPLQLEGREPLVLTVGAVLEENLLRKGLLPFVQSAAYLPDVKFVLVGRWHDSSVEHLKTLATSNVELSSFLPDDELWALYSRASVYVQASMHESFGLSLAEACASGCVPVMTRVGAMPEVVGEAGIYSSSNEPQELARAISLALEAPAELRSQARERVLTHFPMQRREQLLEQLLRSKTGCSAMPSPATEAAGN